MSDNPQELYQPEYVAALREQVRVLREALERIALDDDNYGHGDIAHAALTAADQPKGGTE